MIRATVGILAGVGGGFDADYQAVLDYATTQTYTLPSESQQALQNQLVVDLKSAGVWSKLDTFYVFATDGDREYAAINWKDPNSFEITEVNSPTFTTDVGFTGNGTSAYLDPSYNQGTDGVNWSNPNGSFGVWVDTAATINKHSYVGYVQTNSTLRRGGIKNINTIGLSVIGDVNDTFMHININSTNSEMFYNGSSQATQTGTFVNAGNMDFLRESGTGGTFSDGTISIGFFGGDLSSEQGDFYTAVNSYMTSI
jgi:hypothetical protein